MFARFVVIIFAKMTYAILYLNIRAIKTIVVRERISIVGTTHDKSYIYKTRSKETHK